MSSRYRARNQCPHYCDSCDVGLDCPEATDSADPWIKGVNESQAERSIRAVLGEIWHERVKQDAQWGEQNHSDPEWLAILMEEVGEVSECVVEMRFDNEGKREGYDRLMDYELVQVAAVCAAWLESRRRQRKQDGR